LFQKRNSPLVIWIVAIEIGDKRTCITDCGHGRRNLRRAFVAGDWLPTMQPARSLVME
jgi:hypothetical protein